MKFQKKKRCKLCNKRKAVYIINGRAKWDRHHDLCPECWRSVYNSMTAKVNRLEIKEVIEVG